MHKEYEPHSFIKKVPLETEDVYLIYKRSFFEDISDINDIFNASEIIISNNSEEDSSTISFYFDFEEDSLNIVNSVKNKLSNI